MVNKLKKFRIEYKDGRIQMSRGSLLQWLVLPTVSILSGYWGNANPVRAEASDGPGKTPAMGELLSALILSLSNAQWIELKKRKLDGNTSVIK